MAGTVSVGLWLVVAALAEAAPTKTPRTWFGEIGAGYGDYSADSGHGAGAYGRLTAIRPNLDFWRLELGRASRFDEHGTSVALTYGYTLPSKLGFSLGVTVGTGDLAPAYRFEGTVSKPVLEKQNLILTFRLKEEQSNYENGSSGASAGFVYYFPRHWIVEVNGRYEIGQPGSTDSQGIGGALTWGLYKRIYVTAGFDYGDSSYVVVGADQVAVDLTGRTYSLAVQHHVRPHWGWNARIEAGSNDLYSGRGIQVGLFREW